MCKPCINQLSIVPYWMRSYNNNYHGSPGEGFGIATITKCNMTVSGDT